MSRIDEIEWKDSEGLEDLVTWGIDPIILIVRILDEEYGHTDEVPFDMKQRLGILTHLIEEKATDLKNAFYRIRDEIRKAGEVQDVGD